MHLHVIVYIHVLCDRVWLLTHKCDDLYPVCSKLHYVCILAQYGPTMNVVHQYCSQAYPQALFSALQCCTLKSLLFSVQHCKRQRMGWRLQCSCQYIHTSKSSCSRGINRISETGGNLWYYNCGQQPQHSRASGGTLFQNLRHSESDFGDFLVHFNPFQTLAYHFTLLLEYALASISEM